MFALPSLWNLIISTFVFIIAAKYLHIFLEGKGLAKGMPRGTLVFAVAYLMSWGSGEMVDWTQEKIGIAQPAAQNPDDLQQMMKILTSVVTPEPLVQGSK